MQDSSPLSARSKNLAISWPGFGALSPFFGPCIRMVTFVRAGQAGLDELLPHALELERRELPGTQRRVQLAKARIAAWTFFDSDVGLPSFR